MIFPDHPGLDLVKGVEKLGESCTLLLVIEWSFWRGFSVIMAFGSGDGSGELIFYSFSFHPFMMENLWAWPLDLVINMRTK
jgi:hypothetical protein